MQEQITNILWTGGWDSTYRMVELSRMGITVRPVYCYDPGRMSSEIELQTMERILKALETRPETTSRFLPIEVIKLEDIPEQQEISEAFRVLSGQIRIGGQYDWLARIALQYPGLEMGIEKPHGEYSGCVAVMEAFGALTRLPDGVTVLDKEKSTKECCLVMGNFKFPILHLTEQDMVVNIRSWGYEDIMGMIWFCHSPLRGTPCGMCRPCQQKMECGMSWLVPEKGQKRYRAFSRTKQLFGNFVARGMARYVYRKIL